MSRFFTFFSAMVLISTAFAMADKPSSTQPRPAHVPSPSPTIPSIEGIWEESPGVAVKITQDGSDWTAECHYVTKDQEQIKWVIKSGTITADGKLMAKLHHTQAPANWNMWQVREGALSEDGNTISGTESWDGGGGKFTWTRKQGDRPPRIEAISSKAGRSAIAKHLSAISKADAIHAKAKEDADQEYVSDLKDALKKAMTDGDLEEANSINAEIKFVGASGLTTDLHDWVIARHSFQYHIGTLIFELNLLANGTVGSPTNTLTLERRWSISPDGKDILITGDGGECDFKRCSDGSFRGIWRNGEGAILSDLHKQGE